MQRVPTIMAGFGDRASGFDGAVSAHFAQSHKSRQNCLRFVFQGDVVSFEVAPDLSFGDVARALRELIPGHYGEPVSIECIQTNG